MNIYYRKKDKSLGHFDVDLENHEESINVVKEHLKITESYYPAAVLALIEGGKQDAKEAA